MTLEKFELVKNEFSLLYPHNPNVAIWNEIQELEMLLLQKSKIVITVAPKQRYGHNMGKFTYKKCVVVLAFDYVDNFHEFEFADNLELNEDLLRVSELLQELWDKYDSLKKSEAKALCSEFTQHHKKLKDLELIRETYYEKYPHS